MQTQFSLAQLAEPDTKEANDILRSCTHCGFCTATCPTYVLLGDENDSPRGRIYLIKNMLEDGGTPDDKTVLHLDRCLTCLSCMTTCPATVNYAHLLEHGRRHIEETYTRPLPDRLLRRLLEELIPYRRRFRAALLGAQLVRPVADWLPGRLGNLAATAPSKLPSPSWAERPGVYPAAGERRMRVALLAGCAQPVVSPEIHAATIRLLTRHGVEVVVPKDAGCCGAIVTHMGREEAAKPHARRTIAAWERELDGEGLDAIVSNTSGCGPTIKGYGHLFRHDPAWKDRAERVSALARDITEVLAELDLRVEDPPGLRVTYHAACSLQHGQGITRTPKDLLRAAGYSVRELPEAHICCGSAGTYSLLQPELATQLRDRKAGHIARTQPEVVATGNVGCQTHLSAALDAPIVHTVELLDWATGGPRPDGVPAPGAMGEAAE